MVTAGDCCFAGPRCNQNVDVNLASQTIMDKLADFPDKAISAGGAVSDWFLSLGVHRFREACRYVHRLPYGYNSDRDDLMILFEEGFGSCTTKHAVIATLAHELGLPIGKSIGIYAMTEALVTGSAAILAKYSLPYVPMVHCFLAGGGVRVDLTEGNRNGKNRPIDDLLHTEKVPANISAKEEYLLYRKVLKAHVLPRPELEGVAMKTILKAREDGLALLRHKISPKRGAGSAKKFGQPSGMMAARPKQEKS